MFGGRYNRGDGLLMSLYPQQLQEEIKEDEANGIIQPIEKRRTILKSTQCKLKHFTTNGATMTFVTSGCGIIGMEILQTKINNEIKTYTHSVQSNSAQTDIYINVNIQDMNVNDVYSVIFYGKVYSSPTVYVNSTLTWNKYNL